MPQAGHGEQTSHRMNGAARTRCVSSAPSNQLPTREQPFAEPYHER